MHTKDDKANEVSENVNDEDVQTPFEKAENAAGPVILFFILGLIASSIVGWVIFPKLCLIGWF